MNELVEELFEDGKERMDKAILSFKNELNTVRTGRASTALLDRVIVDYYGTNTPLNQLASVSAPEARLLVITPYDKSAIKQMESAILNSELGLNPANDGNIIRLQIPELTEERRKELVRVVRQIAESGRVAVRNIRRHVIHEIKDLKKEGIISEDEMHWAEDELQKITDGHTDSIDEILKNKEEEILEV